MLNSKEFTNLLKFAGFSFFVGVPDSTLKEWLKTIEGEKNIKSVNECEALAIASGYNLGTGKIACVYLQNAGLGKLVNPLTSLCDKEIYSIPALLLIGWRGQPGVTDEPQHKKMGRITLSILEDLEIPYKILSDDIKEAEKEIIEAEKWMQKNSAPYALIAKRGIFEKSNNIDVKDIGNLTREEAMKIIVDKLSDNVAIISTTGKLSRELFEYRKGKIGNDFLTVGSMGCASSIALGISLSNPDKKIVILDGDGAVLMQLGSLASIGHYAPKNLLHIIFDNKSYDSTGGQETISDSVNFKDIAVSCGYKSAFIIEEQELKDFSFKIQDGPNMIVIKVKKGARKDLGRPNISPFENKQKFVEKLQKGEKK